MDNEGKTIGEMNGPWAIALKISLSLMPVWVAWASFITVNQIKDNEFRAVGPRLTPEMQNSREKALLSPIRQELARINQTLLSELASRQDMLEHERLGGHAVIEQRVTALESKYREDRQEDLKLLRELLELAKEKNHFKE